MQLTRGQSDFRVYAVKNDEVAERLVDDPLPTITDDRATADAITEQLAKPKPTDLVTVADPAASQVISLIRQPLAALEASPDPLAGRAAEIVVERAQARALADPPSSLIATLGPRPDGDASAWDNAVRQWATYTQRWQPTPGSADAEPLLAASAPPAQVHDYQTVQTAITEARATQRHDTSPAELAEQRRDALKRVAGTPEVDVRTQQAIVERAEAKVQRLQRRLDRAHAAHHSATRPRAFKRDPDSAELTRRNVADIQGDLGVARAEHTIAQSDLRAAPISATTRQRAITDLAVIDRVVDHQVATAKRTPAAYRDAALGPRPQGGAASRRWDQAAEATERYRIATLGVGPTAGPAAAGEGLNAAIGRRPHHSGHAKAWDSVNTTIQSLHKPPLKVPQTQPIRISR